ncbi:MAG: hypothetical protein VXY07_05695 [Planctomycetota bacterium]|jgi:hypothetical protein|nr:hypothetical protein [Planctomycetota bacterium]
MIFGRLRFLGAVLVIGMTGCQWSSDGSVTDRKPTKTDGRAAMNAWNSEEGNANDLDTSIISSDAFAALVVKPQRLLSQSWAQDEKIKAGLLELVDRLGFSPMDCKTMLVAISPPQTPEDIPMVGRMDFETPIDLSSIAQEFGDALSLIEEGGVSYFVTSDQKMAYRSAGEGVIYFGELKRLRQLEQKSSAAGALARRLRGIELSGDATLLVDFAPIRPLLAQAASMTQQPFAGPSPEEEGVPLEKLLAQLDSLSMSLDTAAEEVVVAEMDLGDSELAAQIAASSKKQISQFKIIGPLALSAALSGVPDDVSSAVSTLLYGVLGGLKITSSDNQVVAKLRLPNNIADQFQVLLAYAGQLQLQEERSESFAVLGNALAEVLEQGYVPPSIEDHPEWFDADGQSKLSWRVHLLPLLGEAELHAKFKLDEDWDSEHNLELLEEIPEIFQSVEGSSQSSFLGFGGEGMSMASGMLHKPDDLKDDADLTIMLMDVGDRLAVPWTQPIDLLSLEVEKLAEIADDTSGKIQVITVSGKKRTLQKRLSLEQLQAMLSIAGGEEVLDSVFESETPIPSFPSGAAASPF